LLIGKFVAHKSHFGKMGAGNVQFADHFHRPVDGCIPGNNNHSENLQATLQTTNISKAL
jgi:hypothetical protein